LVTVQVHDMGYSKQKGTEMKYKNIRCIANYNRCWDAEYVTETGKTISLHCCSCKTKKQAYALAKEQVDFLNGKEA